ncbi:MAG: Lrp/AsnC ligand binding domain-containing protein [Thermoleophilia bacterium]|nr:Lrp/AsnC ligand binding domain-containing protein [Thermoleophilia bacterium]
MITAFVLIDVERSVLPTIAEALVEVDGVAEVYSVAGEFDFVAVVRVAAYEDLAHVVTERLAAIEGIAGTETLMAFRCYSKHDLERMWNIGAEGSEVDLH